MKTKIFVTAAATFFSTMLFAQQMTHNAVGTTFGVRAGVNFNTITGKNASGDKLDNNINTGYHVGVNAEIPVGTGSYLQPGILYSQKGVEFQNNDELRINYIEVPVNFIYKPTLGTGRVLLGFGPYAGIGIGGKLQTNDGKQEDLEFTNDYQSGINANRQYKRIDGGANFLAGYEFHNNISFQVNAQLGLTQLAPDANGEDNKAKQNHTGFGLSVGYRF
jgi:hypothetical protein